MRNFPNWIEAYLKYCEPTEPPELFCKWVAIWCLGAVVHRRVVFQTIGYRWWPNHYVVLVGPPGGPRKSSAISRGLDILREVDDVPFFAPQTGTWQSFLQDMASPNNRRPVVSDEIDPNTLQPKEVQVSPALLAINEMGTWIRTEDEEKDIMMVSIYDGEIAGKDAFDRATKQDGRIVVPRPYVALIAATTPAWMASNFSDEMMRGGLVSRTTFIYAEEPRRRIAYPALPRDDIVEYRAKLLEDLNAIGKLHGEFTLTPEARAWGEYWYNEIDPKTDNIQMLDRRIVGYRTRRQCHVHKVAMTLSLAERDDLVLEKHHLTQAVDLLSEVEHTLGAVFNFVGASAHGQHMEQIASWLSLGALTETELWGYCYMQMTDHEFKRAISSLIRADRLSASVSGTTTTYQLKGPK